MWKRFRRSERWHRQGFVDVADRPRARSRTRKTEDDDEGDHEHKTLCRQAAPATILVATINSRFAFIMHPRQKSTIDAIVVARLFKGEPPGYKDSKGMWQRGGSHLSMTLVFHLEPDR
ncbi:MAG: hypothetical protein DMG06_12820 [Acidobacteria bacterium]|nr:MAG: hypothetical protein DMG06_12820 [Acidobacteriota bacterium]